MERRTAQDPQAAVATDETLMERYRDGDAGAFDILYGRHRGGVYRYLLRQCGRRAVADELFQDVWMNLIGARRRYVVDARFATWLYKIAHNRLIDHYRATSSGVPASFDDEDGPSLDAVDAGRTADPAVRAESRQQARLLLESIEALPAAQREAFLMQQEAGLSVEDIAVATGVSRETAKSRLRYAIGRLRAASQLAASIGSQTTTPAPAAPGVAAGVAVLIAPRPVGPGAER